MQTAPIPEITNLIEWENATSLTEDDHLLLRSFDQPRPPLSTPDPLFDPLIDPLFDPPFDPLSDPLSNLSRIFVKNSSKDELDPIINELKEIKAQNSYFEEILQKILYEFSACESNLSALSLTKESLIKRINELYQESSEIIEQQKNLLDFNGIIKGNLLYYTEYKRIETDIENIHMNLASKEEFENNLQRYLSEIMDGIIFFEMKQNYQKSRIFYENYSKLKKRLLLVIKTLFLKILNKEFTEISANIAKIPLNDFFASFSFATPHRVSPLNSTRTLFLATFYPEFRGFFLESSHEFADKFELAEPFVKINGILRNLLNFMYNSSKNDWDVNEILIDLFESYYPYYRDNILLIFCQKLTKFLGKKPVKLPDLLEAFLLFAEENTLFEYFYYLFLFNFDQEFEKNKVLGFLKEFSGKFYDFIRTFVVREAALNNIYESIDILNNFITNSREILDDFLESPVLKKIVKSGNFAKNSFFSENSKICENFEKIVKSEIHLKIKQDLLQKLAFLIQGLIQEKIVNFELKPFLKPKKLALFTTIPASQRLDVFPMVLLTIDLIESLKTRMEKSILQEIIYEVISHTLNAIFTVSETFEGKFDAFLFVIKHLLLLNGVLCEIGIEILVKEQKFDFSETKNTIFELISLGNSEKNVKESWNFMSFLTKGMPKVNEYVIDVKKSLLEQINTINSRFLKDMSFIISKNLCDFLRKYHSLKNLLKHCANNEFSLKKDLEDMMKKENIKKIYEVFFENFKETVEEIVRKANNFLDCELFAKVAKYLDAIIENVMLLLYQFYIIAAENVSNEEYKTLGFVEIEEIRKELKKKIVFIC